MNPVIEKHIAAVKELLYQGEEKDNDELAFLVQQEEHDFEADLEKSLAPGELELEGEQIVFGLLTKLKRIYPVEPQIFERDKESLLAVNPDILGMGSQEEACRYDSEDHPEIIQTISSFLDERSQKAEYENDEPLLRNILDPLSSMLVRDNTPKITRYLEVLSQDFINYIKNYRPDFWNWQVDLLVLSQYVFEKAVELMISLSNGEWIDYEDYDIREAFTYYELRIPVQLQNAINAKVSALESVIEDVSNFIDNRGYHTCPLEVWFRTALCKVGLLGVQFALENQEETTC